MKHVAVVLILVSAFSLAASADTIRGVVRNGTTNKPAAGDEVILKKIARGMEDAGKTKTNAKGEFSFDVPAGGQQPYVLWVKHQEVTYPKVAMPGSGTVAVQVFDASPAVKEITLQEHILAMQTSPAGDSLKVDAIFTVANQSSPPRTKNGQHTFDIYLPDNAKVEEATAQTAGNMALKTPVVPDTSEKNKYFFGYPLRPGQTQFRLSYSVPYSGKLSLTPKLSLPAENMVIVIPPTINLVPEDNSVYTPRSDPQFKNVSLYVAKDLKANSKLGFQLQGTGELPREEASTGGNAGGGQAQGEDTRPGGGLGVPNERPDPLHSGQWLFLGVLAVFLTAGAVYIYTSKPAEAAASKPAKRGGGPSALLDVMKEELFQLESDRLQGKITQQEYESTKAALDKTLQRAVKRQATAK